MDTSKIKVIINEGKIFYSWIPAYAGMTFPPKMTRLRRPREGGDPAVGLNIIKKLCDTLIIILVSFSLIPIAHADDQKALMAQRIAPVGVSNTTAQTIVTTTPPVELTLVEQLKLGKQIYQKRCAFCHASGSAGAPKVSNGKDWNQRYKQGFETLVEHVNKGYRMMPPKGTCMSCSPQDLAAAVRYMLELSGVKDKSTWEFKHAKKY